MPRMVVEVAVEEAVVEEEVAAVEEEEEDTIADEMVTEGEPEDPLDHHEANIETTLLAIMVAVAILVAVVVEILVVVETSAVVEVVVTEMKAEGPDMVIPTAAMQRQHIAAAHRFVAGIDRLVDVSNSMLKHERKGSIYVIHYVA